MSWSKENPTEEGWYWVRGVYANDYVFELYGHADREHLIFSDEVNHFEVGINTEGLEFSKILHPDNAELAGPTAQGGSGE